MSTAEQAGWSPAAGRADAPCGVSARGRAPVVAPGLSPVLPSAPAPRIENGFTLVELLITLALVAVLLNVAAPSFRDIVADLAQSAEHNVLARDLRLARSEAIKRGAPVTLCASGGANGCGSAWQDGWYVFVDGAGGTAGDIDAGEPVLRAHRVEPASGFGLSARALVRPAPIGPVEAIAFDARGRADWTLGTFVLCDSRGAEEALALIVNAAGGARQAAESVASPGVVVDALGQPVTC